MGSHKFFEHPDGRATVVSFHYEIGLKLLKEIIKEIKMTEEEFEKLL